MDLMTRWLQSYEKRRHSRRNSKQHLKEPNESWISSKYDLQGMDWQTLQQMYLPELKMCFGPACNSLKKLWKSYKIAGRTGEPRSDIAWKINQIQKAMGIEVSQFPELESMGIYENEYQGQIFEQERLTPEEIQLRREEELERREWVNQQTNAIGGSEFSEDAEEYNPEETALDRQLKREEREDKQNSSVFNQLKEAWGDEDSDEDGW